MRRFYRASVLMACFLMILCLAVPAAEAWRTVLSGKVSIVIDAEEKPPLHRAVQDLRRDLKKVFGVEPSIYNDIASAGEGPVLIVTCEGKSTEAFRSPKVSGFEAHAVFAKEFDKVPCVVMQGSDLRGAIYAVYSFSEDVLDIPPLWFWASIEPEKRTHISIPLPYSRIFESPYVKWRAWFPNDRDLLTPWQERSEENYEAFFETMLRLKMNTLEGRLMDTKAFDHPLTAGKEARTARDRGLAITGHHIYTFGASMRNWEIFWKKIKHQEPPKLSIHDLDSLKIFWRYHIETSLAEDMEVIWLIGFRADRDAPFWALYEDAPKSDVERGKVIEEMMHAQVALLKEVTGDPAPIMRTTLYNEKSKLFAAGLLRPPDEPTLIWNFVAARRDHFPAPDFQHFKFLPVRPIGYYMNLQFTSTGAHLAQAEGPWKMHLNYCYMDYPGERLLEFSVVNAGNIREFVLTLSANAQLLWDFEGYRPRTFVSSFSDTYFGRKLGSSVASMYQDFFNSYWCQKKPDLPHVSNLYQRPKDPDRPNFPRQYIFQDMRYARAMEQLCAQFKKGYDPNPLVDKGFSSPGEYFRIVPEDSGASNQLEAIINGTKSSRRRLEELAKQSDKYLEWLEPENRPFFNDNLRVQIYFMLRMNEALSALTHGFMELEHGKKDKVLPHIEASFAALSKAKSVLEEAEHGRFEGWYDTDEKFNLGRLQERLTQLYNNLTSLAGN